MGERRGGEAEVKQAWRKRRREKEGKRIRGRGSVGQDTGRKEKWRRKKGENQDPFLPKQAILGSSNSIR